jgi:hypothetical protein
MDKHLTLLAALQARAEQSEQTVRAEEVRSVGRAIGLADTELISVLEALTAQGLARIQWGGEVRLLEGQGKTGGWSDEGAGPSLSGTFHGPVIYSTGQGARIDTRGSGRGAAYKTNTGEPEAAFGILAAAIVELQMRVSELDSDVSAKVQALETAAREVAEQGTRAEPDKPTLSQRLQALTARLEDVAELASAVTKLEPALTMIKSAGVALKTWMLGS